MLESNQFQGTKSGGSFVCHYVKSDQLSSNRPLHNFRSHLANNVSCKSHDKVSINLGNLSLNNIHDSYNVATLIDGEILIIFRSKVIMIVLLMMKKIYSLIFHVLVRTQLLLN